MRDDLVPAAQALAIVLEGAAPAQDERFRFVQRMAACWPAI